MSRVHMPCRAHPRSTLALVLTLGVAWAAALPVLAHPPTPGPTAAGPDLVLLEITSPSVVDENDVVSLGVRIENRGDIAAWAATVTFVDAQPNGDVVPVGEGFLSAPLDPRASVVLEGPAFVAVGAGKHTLTARLADVEPPESNTTSDVLSVPLTVRPAPGTRPPPPTSDGGVRIEALQGLAISGLIVLVLLAVVGLVIAGALRGPREDSLVPPPPEPPDERPPPIWPP